MRVLRWPERDAERRGRRLFGADRTRASRRLGVRGWFFGGGDFGLARGWGGFGAIVHGLRSVGRLGIFFYC